MVLEQCDRNAIGGISICCMHESAWCRPWRSPVKRRLCFSRRRRRLGRRRGEGPSWRAVLCTADGFTSLRLRGSGAGSYLPRYGQSAALVAHACVLSGMLDDGTQLRPAELHARQMSCCWASSAPPEQRSSSRAEPGSAILVATCRR